MLKRFMLVTPLLAVFALACSDEDTAAKDGGSGGEMLSATGGTDAGKDEAEDDDFCDSSGIGVMVPEAEEGCSDGEGGYLPCRSPCEPDCEDDECSGNNYVCNGFAQCVTAP